MKPESKWLGCNRKWMTITGVNWRWTSHLWTKMEDLRWVRGCGPSRRKYHFFCHLWREISTKGYFIYLIELSILLNFVCIQIHFGRWQLSVTVVFHHFVYFSCLQSRGAAFAFYFLPSVALVFCFVQSQLATSNKKNVDRGTFFFCRSVRRSDFSRNENNKRNLLSIYQIIFFFITYFSQIQCCKISSAKHFVPSPTEFIRTFRRRPERPTFFPPN